MSQRGATIRSLRQASRMIKEMENHGYEWGEDYRLHTRLYLKELLEGRMRQGIDNYLENLSRRVGVDRRNGPYRRHLLTELGDIELEAPRTRHDSALRVVKAYARRAPCLNRLILACFVFGVSTRKVAEVLLPILGEPVSPSTVSRVANNWIGRSRPSIGGTYPMSTVCWSSMAWSWREKRGREPFEDPSW